MPENTRKNPTVSYAEFIVRRRWFVLFASLILVFLTAYGAKNTYFSSDYRIFFGPDNPQLAAQDDLERTYTKVDMISFILKPDEGDVYNKRILGIIQDITEKSWQIPYTIRVDSLSNFQHTRSEEDDMIVEDLVGDLEDLGPQQLAAIRAISLSEPTLIKRLISSDGKTTQISITVELPSAEGSIIKEIVKPVREMAADIRARNPDIHVALGGNIMLSNTFAESAEHDMTTLFPLMYGLLALTILLFIRSVAGMLSAMTIVFLSVITAIGVTGYIGWGLNTASVNSFVIILTISVADSIHLLITYFSELSKGKDRQKASGKLAD
ncbi:MAG: MMPL family transporter, partial [Emcibacter sp.]|nr:MMPL family transporter [Emcibacter sp.]